jgi:5-methylcytosine-specific restriction endonuclease McrA
MRKRIEEKKMVYVLSKDGSPLMPTGKHGKVKRLLRAGKARVVRRCPFTIQLCYESAQHVQPITLGVDAGSKTIGLSATTEKKELYAAEVELRSDIPDLLATRREYRRARRHRTTRYRAPRFDNRRKGNGWLAPSVRQKIETHLKVVREVHQILPVSNIVVETAAFDIQKIKNPAIEGAEYQQGDRMGFWNVREYVLFRDGHTCQHCKGKSKDKVLNVHHLESRKTGGDAPNNLITLCETCHSAYHAGKIALKAKRGVSYADAAFMGIMQWAFYEQLKAEYTAVSMTYGYITKHTRIANGLDKSHRIDARCISGNPMAKPMSEWYAQKAVRRHNRQTHKTTIKKGGYRKLNQAPKYVFGYELFDKVKLTGEEGFIFGRRSSGSFDVRKLDGMRLSAGVSYKKLRLLEKSKTLLTEKRPV